MKTFSLQILVLLTVLSAASVPSQAQQPFCQEAVTVQCMELWTAANNSIGSTNAIFQYEGCGGNKYTGPELAFRFDAPWDMNGVDEEVRVYVVGSAQTQFPPNNPTQPTEIGDLEPLNGDVDLKVLSHSDDPANGFQTEGCNPNDWCHASSDRGQLQGEDEQFAVDKDETYWFIVDGWQGAVTDFKMFVWCGVMQRSGLETGDLADWSLIHGG